MSVMCVFSHAGNIFLYVGSIFSYVGSIFWYVGDIFLYFFVFFCMLENGKKLPLINLP